MTLLKGSSAKTSPNITKADLLMLADVIHNWTPTTLQVIELKEFSDALAKHNKARLTLIINVENQWNPVIIDERRCVYLAYTYGKKGKWIDLLNKNSLTNIQTIRMKKTHNGISALIIAKVINDIIENSPTIPVYIKSTVIMEFVTPDLMEYIENSLRTFRKMRNQFKHVISKPSSVKRRASSELESHAQLPAKVSKPSPDSDRPCFNESDDSSKVVIRNTDPKTKDLKDSFCKCINASIGMIEENGVVPRLVDLSCIPGGCLILTCEDAVSVKWLIQEVPKIRSNDMKLSILPVICNTLIPKSQVNNTKEAFNLLKKQNRGLNTELWYILDSKSDLSGFSVSVAIDEPSARVLCALEWRAKLGLIYIKFIPESNFLPVAETNAADDKTISENPEISSHNASVSSCATLRANVTPADGTSGHQESSAPQVGTREPSTTLDIGKSKDVKTARRAQAVEILDMKIYQPNTSGVSHQVDRTTIVPTAVTPEPAIYSQVKSQTLQTSTPNATIVQKLTTPIAASVPQIDSGIESFPNKHYTPSGRQDQTASEIITVEAMPQQLAMSTHNNSGSSHTTLTKQVIIAVETSGPQEGCAPQVETSEPSRTLAISEPKGIEITLVSHGSLDLSETPEESNDSSKENLSQQTIKINTAASPEQAFCSQAQLQTPQNGTVSSCVPSVQDVITPTATNSVQQLDPGIQSSDANTFSIFSVKDDRQELSQQTSAPTGIIAQQGHSGSSAKMNEVKNIARKDNKKSQEGSAYLNPLSLEATSNVQPKHRKLPKSTSTTPATAAECPRQDVPSPVERSKKVVSSQLPHSQLAPVPASQNKHPRSSKSQAEKRKDNVNVIGRDNKERRAFLNPLNVVDACNIQNNNYTSSQTALTSTASAAVWPGQVLQSTTRGSPKESSSYSVTNSQWDPAPTGHHQQRRPESREFESDYKMMRIYREMRKIHYGTDQPES